MRPDRELRNRERNELLFDIREKGFDPEDFSWDVRFSRITEIIASLEHAASGSYFAIGVSTDGTYYYGDCDPGLLAQVEQISASDWPEMRDKFRNWLNYLKEDIEAPDEWASLDEARQQLADALGDEVDSTALISREERARISEHLKSLRETITANHELTSEQLAVMDLRLEELERASERLTRRDYLNYVIGGVITIAIELSLKTPMMGELVRTTVEVMISIIGGARELPPHVPM